MPANVANRATVPPLHVIFKTVTSANTTLNWVSSLLTRVTACTGQQSLLWTELGGGHESSVRWSGTDCHHFNPTFQQFLMHKPFSDCCVACGPFPGCWNNWFSLGRGGLGQSILSCFIAIFLGERIWQSLFTQITAGSYFQSWLILKIKTYTLEDYVRKNARDEKRNWRDRETSPAASSPVSTCSKSPKVGFFSKKLYLIEIHQPLP